MIDTVQYNINDTRQ